MDELGTLGEWLKQRRRALHLTQEAVAKQLYCALGTLRKIEADERRPSQELAERLAQVLQVPSEHQTTFVKVARAELALDRLVLSPDPATGIVATKWARYESRQRRAENERLGVPFTFTSLTHVRRIIWFRWPFTP